jgi:hypothetical protein
MNIEEMRNAYRILARMLGEKRSLGRHRRKDNIKMDLTETRCENVDWIHPVACFCENGNEASYSIKGREFLG